MTEAELWDQQVQWVMGGGNSMMSLISIMFAFLVMAHYVGSKLTRVQAAMVSALFVWASLLITYGAVGYFYRAQMFAERLRELDAELVFFLSTGSTVTVGLMMLIGIIVCLIFFYQARKRPE